MLIVLTQSNVIRLSSDCWYQSYSKLESGKLASLKKIQTEENYWVRISILLLLSIKLISVD